MECQSPEDTTQFQLADVESAKYVWRMCVHQVSQGVEKESIPRQIKVLCRNRGIFGQKQKFRKWGGNFLQILKRFVHRKGNILGFFLAEGQFKAGYDHFDIRHFVIILFSS